MQININAEQLLEVNLQDISYQYDSNDKELFLEDGYIYSVYTLNNDNLLTKDTIDLRGDNDN